MLITRLAAITHWTEGQNSGFLYYRISLLDTLLQDVLLSPMATRKEWSQNSRSAVEVVRFRDESPNQV
jgi:hypothetical protein